MARVGGPRTHRVELAANTIEGVQPPQTGRGGRSDARAPDLDAAACSAHAARMPIRLDVLRHGLALPSSPTGDQDRVLSEQGTLEIRRLAAALVREHWRPTLALTSPYLRARQTAALMLESLPEVALESLEALSPDVLTAELVTELAAWVEADAHLLLVTHQPLAGEFVNQLTNQSVSLAPGTLIELECELPLAAGAGRVVGIRRAPDL